MPVQPSPRTTAVGLSLLGAGVIHLAAVGTHRQSPMAIASFVGIGLAQMLIGGVWLTGVAPRYLRMGAAAVTVPALLFWLASRTVGLPVWTGHHTGAEAVGLGDVIAVGLQLAALALAFLPARARQSVTTRPLSHLAIVILPALLTVAGSFGTAAAGHNDPGTPGASEPTEHGHDDSATAHGH